MEMKTTLLDVNFDIYIYINNIVYINDIFR